MLNEVQTQVLMEMVADRGYLPTSGQTNTFNVSFQIGKGNISIQEIYNGLRKSRPAEVSIYSHGLESDKYLLVFVGYSTGSTGKFPAELAIPFNDLLMKIDSTPSEIVMLLDKYISPRSIDQLAIYQDKLTIMSKRELSFNPSRHIYSPVLTRAGDQIKFLETQKRFLNKRLESDRLCRYYGFKAGEILVETTPMIFSTSLVRSEAYFIYVVRGEVKFQK